MKIFSVRYWGSWEQNPYEEDCDFEQLSEKSYKSLREVIKDTEKRYRKDNISIQFDVGEKNYINILVENKRHECI